MFGPINKYGHWTITHNTEIRDKYKDHDDVHERTKRTRQAGHVLQREQGFF